MPGKFPPKALPPTTMLYECDSKFRQSGEIANFVVNNTPFRRGTIKLSSIVIPLTHDVIDAADHFVHIAKNGQILKEPFPSGNYSLYNIASTLQNILNRTDDQEYKVKYFNERIQIEAKEEFKLIHENNCLWERLGFLNKDFSGVIHVADVPPNLSLEGRYYLDLGGLIIQGNYSNGSALANKIPLLLRGNLYEIAKCENIPSISMPISGQPQMSVRLCDSNGKTVKLKKDWSFILEYKE